MSFAAPKHLFVYGTLRDDLHHDIYRVLVRASRFVDEGVVHAKLFDLGKYPGMVLSDSGEDRVKGEVYRLASGTANATLKILDDYEGLGPTVPIPHEYRRQVVKVRLKNGLIVSAWAYVLATEQPKRPRIHSEDYLEWRQGQGA